MSGLKTIIAYPYKGDTNLEAILEAVDNWFQDATTGFYKKSEQIQIWDIDNITDSYQLDLLAYSIGLYGWDKSWSLDEKKEKLKIGIKLKQKIATPWCIKNVAGFVLDPDNIDQTNHPIQLVEGTGGIAYDGTAADYDGTYLYNSAYHWTKFSLVIPYDGDPTAEEIADVTAQINNYKRLVSSLVSISFIRLQTKFLHVRPGDKGYGSVEHDTRLNITGDLTIAIKFWYEGLGGTGGGPAFLGKILSSTVANNPYYMFFTTDDPTTAYLRFYVHNGASASFFDSSNMPNANEWNTLIVRRNSSTNAHEIDLNGTITTATLAHNGNGNTGKFWLNNNPAVSAREGYFYFQDLVIDDQRWTDAQKTTYKNNYGPPAVPSDALAYWRLNEETGNTCAEYFATGMDMTLLDTYYWSDFLEAWGGNSTASDKINNYYPLDEDGVGKVIHDVVSGVSALGQRSMSAVTTTGKFGKGVSNSSASGDYYEFEAEPTEIKIDEAISFGFWVDINGTTGDRTILDFYDDSVTKGMFAFLKATTNTLRVDFFGGSGNEWRCETSTSVGSSTEVFYVFTYDGSGVNTGMKTYRNATEESSRTTFGTVSAIASGLSGYLFKDNSDIGTNIPDLNWFDGFFICNDELTSAEITYIYNKKIGLKYQEEE